ncbi:hypothetical protein [Luteipulveratus mongoliensis]|uniref:Nucleoside 2-deoxyribosyltransferase n=1 Tax=Luteipulveratus mongoliensis TaxID=571913 RepID=A0A0K1JIA0_9MICO|nr:hypothetical protein [Luteipulveratus mongoliensis]AKU16431.1 hypothetical protein VV02_12075 [Luteipulveratus mongoliensis]
MKVYVAGPVADAATVRAVQSEVVAAGHELTLDWTSDLSFSESFASMPDRSAQMAQDEISAVLKADAVLVIASQHDGRGMFVELGAALARAEVGTLDHVVVVGPIQHESVFYFHPKVRRVQTVGEWLEQVGLGSHGAATDCGPQTVDNTRR